LKIGEQNEIVIDKGCRTSVPNVYAIGDAAGPPYFMAVARKRGMIAAQNIMGGNAQWDDTLPLPDHIYLPPLEATTVGLTEEEARKEYGDVVIIRVPWGNRPKKTEPLKYIPHFENQALPVCGRMHSLNLFFYGENRHGLHKAIVDPNSRRYLGFHHVGDGAKTSFQYLSYLLQQGWTIDQMKDLHEIFLNAEHFIQLSRLVAGQKELKGFSEQVVTEDYTR
jgi:dihydrolipoamide dehydrogenase